MDQVGVKQRHCKHKYRPSCKQIAFSKAYWLDLKTQPLDFYLPIKLHLHWAQGLTELFDLTLSTEWLHNNVCLIKATT